jgi:hypothetical protein
MKFRDKKPETPKRVAGGARTKVPSASLHSQGVQVSVDERIADLARRFPALNSAVASFLLEGKKRIRDCAADDQVRLLRMVYALKKAARG